MNLFGYYVPYNQCCILYCLFQFIHVSHGVPHPYCLEPFNRSDCNSKPTLVFSYYKQGSRCELETWRGCPTWNLFLDQYTCSHFCLARLDQDKELQNNAIEEASYCKGLLDTGDCGEKPTKVFTYNKAKHTCVQETWRGCRSSNKFHDEITCIDLCMKVAETTVRWEQIIENLEDNEIEKLKEIVDGAVNNVTSKVAKPLKYLKVTEVTDTDLPHGTVSEVILNPVAYKLRSASKEKH